MRQPREGGRWSPDLLRLWQAEFRDYSRARLLADLQAGLTVACVALPLALAFGVASGSTAAAGLVTAIIAGMLIGVLSGGAHQISGPTGAMSAVLIVIANQHGPVGLWVAGVLAGVIILALGLLRLGRVINLIPEPVIAGFTSGIAVIIVIGQIDNALGIRTGGEENAAHAAWAYVSQPLPPLNMHAVAATALVIAIMALLPRLPGNLRHIPAALLAIASVTLLAWGLDWPVATIGSIPRTLVLEQRLTLDMLTLDLVQQLIGPAIAIAALGAIESLLAGVVTGRMTGNRLNANQELVAQGLGNIVLPFFGGVPATAAIARMSVGVRAGGVTRLTGIIHAVALLACAMFLAATIALIPMPALAGVLIVTAWRMNDWALIRLYSRQRMLQASGVFLLTMLATVSLDLTRAIALGIVVSLALFISNLLRLRGVRALRTLPSIARLQVSLQPLADALHLGQPDVLAFAQPLHIGAAEARQAAPTSAMQAAALARPAHLPIASIHTSSHSHISAPPAHIATLRGPLYFGSVNTFRNLLQEIERLPAPTALILDLSDVPVLDETGVSVLHDLWRDLHLRGQLLLLVGLQPQPLALSQRSGLAHVVGEHLYHDTSSAIAHLQRRTLQPGHAAAA